MLNDLVGLKVFKGQGAFEVSDSVVGNLSFIESGGSVLGNLLKGLDVVLVDLDGAKADVG